MSERVPVAVELAAELGRHCDDRERQECPCGWRDGGDILHLGHVAESLLPVVRAFAEDVRAEERQRIAAKLAAVPDEVYPVDVFGGPLSTDESRQANELLKAEGLPTFDRIGANAMRHAYRVASRLAREQED